MRRGLNLESKIARDERRQFDIDRDFIRVVMSLVNCSWNKKSGDDTPIGRIPGNNIAAIMVDRDNRIIGWGLNLKSHNKTFHAETLMIQRYLRENNTNKLPDGARIYTSLQCCHMCAGHIAELGKDIKVIYAQKDPYFSGKSAIGRNVNGCSENATSLPYAQRFADLIGDRNILDFLFNLNDDGTENHYNQTRNMFAQAMTKSTLLAELRMSHKLRTSNSMSPLSHRSSIDSDATQISGEQKTPSSTHRQQVQTGTGAGAGAGAGSTPKHARLLTIDSGDFEYPLDEPGCLDISREVSPTLKMGAELIQALDGVTSPERMPKLLSRTTSRNSHTSHLSRSTYRSQSSNSANSNGPSLFTTHQSTDEAKPNSNDIKSDCARHSMK